MRTDEPFNFRWSAPAQTRNTKHMKQVYRHNAPPTPESLTRAALKQLTHKQMLAAKFAEEIMRKPVTNLLKPESKPEPMTFSLGSLIP